MQLDASEVTHSSREKPGEYDMSHPQRGHALILHHFEFSKQLNHLRPREGSYVDLARLREILGSLGFEIHVHEDQTVEQITKIITHCKLMAAIKIVFIVLRNLMSAFRTKMRLKQQEKYVCMCKMLYLLPGSDTDNPSLKLKLH